jgi:4-hydroxybutyrate CoA-transferase
MKWREVYEKKLTTADEAVKKIKSGDRIVVGHACASPEILLKAMLANKEAYRNVEIVHMVSMGQSEYCRPENAAYFVHNSFFAGTTTRDSINQGRAHFTPCHFSMIPKLFSENVLPVDVLMCMLSAPDQDGYCSFGISVDYTKPAAKAAKLIIAEVTPNMPRTLGDSFIHVSKLDYIVECDSKPIFLTPPAISAVDEAIGGHCAELIKDGDCLQLGIGAVPDAILGYLKNKKHLGIHTEMFSDGVVDLVHAGVIDCSEKTFHPGKMVASFLMGTEKLYHFVDNNPMVEMFSVEYTNNPSSIAKNDNMVSINSALEIDLAGQVVSDTIGYRQYSGAGGQADFVRGVAWSKGGRSIIALHSTANKGKVSRITPHVAEGAAIVTNRTDVQYVVTEYGIASLRGKTIAQRAKELISIAHPDFRNSLREDFHSLYHY